MTNHPITPPPELVKEWVAEIWHEGTTVQVAADNLHIATKAAQWGADQELEAMLAELKALHLPDGYAAMLRAARRPKPPSLKEQALQALAHLENGAHCSMDTTESAHYIRRALESLPD